MANLWSELRTDAVSAKLFPALLVGVLAGSLLLIDGVVLATVIFVGPLSPYLANGIGMLLFGYAAFCVLTGLTSSYRGMIACPQNVAAAVLATIGVTLAANMSGASGETLFMTMVAALILSSTITSLCSLALGQCRIADLLRVVPYPVACGVLAGTGWVLCLAALSMCGLPLEWRTLPRLHEPDMLWRCGVGVAFGLSLLLLSRRWNNLLLLAANFLIFAALYHLGLSVAGLTVEEASEAGLLFAGMPAGGVWPAFQLRDVALVDWGSLAMAAPNLLAVTLVTLFSLAVNLHSLELDAEMEIDKDREFRVAGFAGLVAAVGGSVPGCQSFALSRFGYLLGADTRLTGIVAAGVVSLCALFGGGLVMLVPVPLAAGILLFAGVDLLGRWLFSVRRKLSWTDHGIVVLTCVGIALFGFVAGIGLGLTATMAFLVIRLGGMEVLEAEFTGHDQRSNRHRTIPEGAILFDQGERIRVYRLRGFVFFGSVRRLLDRIRATLTDTPRPACIVLDLAGVSGFDFSAVNTLAGVIRSPHAAGIRLVLAAAPGRLKDNLRDNLPADVCDRVLFEPDADHALERAEDLILAAAREVSGAHDRLLVRVFDDMRRYLDRQIVLEDMVQRLEPWLEPCDYQAGDALAARGEPQAGVQLLVKGRAAVYDGAGLRISQCVPGAAVEPQAAFGPSVAAASTIADASCRTMLLTPNARLLLEVLHPALSLQFYRFLVTQTPQGFPDQRDGNAVRRQLARGAAAGSADRPADPGGSAAAAAAGGSSPQGTGSPDLTGYNGARGGGGANECTGLPRRRQQRAWRGSGKDGSRRWGGDHIAQDRPLYGVEDGSGGSTWMSPAPQMESLRTSRGPTARPLATAAGAILERGVERSGTQVAATAVLDCELESVDEERRVLNPSVTDPRLGRRGPGSAVAITSIPSPENLPEAVIESGSYRLRFARTAGDIDRLLALRFDVFGRELGCLDEPFAAARDTDEFDARCHHLLIEDAHRSVVGNYRLQTAAMAARGRGFWSNGEYQLDAVPWDILSQSVEVGRACTHGRHRKRSTVLFLAWQGLAEYLVHNRLRFVFALCSLASQNEAEGIRLFRQLDAAGKVHPELNVPVRAHARCDAPKSAVEEHPEVEMPAMLAICLRLGALVCGRPAIDRNFKTISYFVLMDTEALSPRLRSRVGLDAAARL